MAECTTQLLKFSEIRFEIVKIYIYFKRDIFWRLDKLEKEGELEIKGIYMNIDRVGIGTHSLPPRESKNTNVKEKLQ